MNPSNGQRRKVWKNYVKDQQADPLLYFRSSGLSELIAIVRDAESKGYNVKATGSGHSSSDVALCDDYMIDTHGLDLELPLSALNLRDELSLSSSLYFTEAGVRIKELNRRLAAKGKALINMGAYDGQTLAGVVSTSTHGSGTRLGAFPAFVRSIILLGEGGRLYQIEPSGERSISKGSVLLAGDHRPELLRDDRLFNAAVVSMGCMGIIYAVVIDVVDSYELKETRQFSVWSKVREQLRTGDVLKDNRHYEVLINPYAYRKKDHKVMVTERNFNPGEKRSTFRRGHRKWFVTALLAVIPNGLIDLVIRTIVNQIPSLVPGFIQLTLAALTDSDYIAASYKVLDLGRANNLSAYGMELAFPSDRYLDAIEEILRIVAQSRAEGNQNLTGPVSLRFVKTNSFYLSMQYGSRQDDFVCMIEFPTISGTIGGIELLGRIEQAMYAYRGVPHWGQVNHLGGMGKAGLSRLYARWPHWLAEYRRVCQLGTFENAFTRRCGIAATRE